MDESGGWLECCEVREGNAFLSMLGEAILEEGIEIGRFAQVEDRNATTLENRKFTTTYFDGLNSFRLIEEIIATDSLEHTRS